MPHHALDVTLTRALTPAELHRAARAMPLATNHDTIRLLALVRARTPAKALNRLRHQMGGRFPIDVITTHYPDPHGQILLNVTFSPAAYAALEPAAERMRRPPHLFVQEAVHRALARHAVEEAERLDRALQHLLAETTPPHLLAAPGRCSPTPPEQHRAEAHRRTASRRRRFPRRPAPGNCEPGQAPARPPHSPNSPAPSGAAAATSPTTAPSHKMPAPVSRSRSDARPPTPWPTPPLATATPTASTPHATPPGRRATPSASPKPSASANAT